MDEYCAKVRRPKCVNFVQTLETAATVSIRVGFAHATSGGLFFLRSIPTLQDGLRMFLGVDGNVSGWNSNEDQCEIFLSKNPLEEWVELPPNMAELRYSNIIGGAIRGALEMVCACIQMQTSSKIISVRI